LPAADAAASSFDGAQDEVDFVARCHEKRILMLSLSKHDEWLCNRSKKRAVDLITSPNAGAQASANALPEKWAPAFAGATMWDEARSVALRSRTTCCPGRAIG
jgi:hypothetical protein